MIGRLIGAALGGAISKEQHKDPVKGALIGAATMAVARRILPRNIATIGAAVATGYVTRKLAQRAERRENGQRVLPAPRSTAQRRSRATPKRAKPTSSSTATD